MCFICSAFFYIVGGKIRSALEIADQLLKIAEELRDPTLAMEAHRAKGATLIEMGRCSEALEHFNRASDLYSANRHLPYTLKIGHDCKVLVECSAARALWALGFPDTALDRMQNGLAFAMELSQPESQMAASHCAAELHRLRGEAVLAKERASEVLRLAEENGLELWIAFGKIDLGSADTELGDIQHGIEQMEQGLAAYEATGGQLWLPLSLCSLADALAKAGQVQRGMAAITRALVMAELNCDGFPQPELHRIKGELLIKGVDLARANNVPNASATSRDRFAEELAQAQACFAEALLIAKEQQTRSWELRVQLSMDRLAQRQGSPVHAQLAESYSSFSEGFDTADLKEAMTRLKGFCESASSAAGTVNSDAAKGARV